MQSFNPTFYAEIKPEFIGKTKVHPADVAVASANPLPVLTLYECLSEDDQYTLVRRTYNESPFRIIASSLVRVEPPRFRLGQAVLALPFDPPKEVVVHRIEWHAARNHEIYFVVRDGKTSTRRYLPSELLAI